MNHPFMRLFERALRASTEDGNEVLRAAEELIEKGYGAEEIIGVLRTFRASLLDDTEESIVADALDAFASDVGEF